MVMVILVMVFLEWFCQKFMIRYSRGNIGAGDVVAFTHKLMSDLLQLKNFLITITFLIPKEFVRGRKTIDTVYLFRMLILCQTQVLGLTKLF